MVQAVGRSPAHRALVVHALHRRGSAASDLERGQVSPVGWVTWVDSGPVLHVVGDEETHHVGHCAFYSEFPGGVVVLCHDAITMSRFEAKT